MTKHRFHHGGPHRSLMPADVREEYFGPKRTVRLQHDGLPFSSALVIVKMLDDIDVAGCDHCADLRYALVAYIRGLRPRPPDVTVDIAERGIVGRHLASGVRS